MLLYITMLAEVCKFNENGSRPYNIHLVIQRRILSSKLKYVLTTIYNIDGSIRRYTIGYIVIGNNNNTFTFSSGESI